MPSRHKADRTPLLSSGNSTASDGRVRRSPKPARMRRLFRRSEEFSAGDEDLPDFFDTRSVDDLPHSYSLDGSLSSHPSTQASLSNKSSSPPHSPPKKQLLVRTFKVSAATSMTTPATPATTETTTPPRNNKLPAPLRRPRLAPPRTPPRKIAADPPSTTKSSSLGTLPRNNNMKKNSRSQPPVPSSLPSPGTFVKKDSDTTVSSASYHHILEQLRQEELSIAEEKKADDADAVAHNKNNNSNTLPRPRSEDSWAESKGERGGRSESGVEEEEDDDVGDDDDDDELERQPQHQAHSTSSAAPDSSVPMTKTRALLSRQFGRTTLPIHGRNTQWVVEISSAEWDADEQKWKYRILVQRRQSKKPNINKRSQSSKQQPQSMTAAFTWRSLADFMWLEKALLQEYNGGLLVPLLSIALGQATESHLEGMPVEADKLRHWLSDTLNGIRGQGEVVLLYGETIDLLQSEAMETFLYKNSGPLDEFQRKAGAGMHNKSSKRSNHESLLLQFLCNNPAMDLCVGQLPDETETTGTSTTRTSPKTSPVRLVRPARRKLPLGMLNCSSRALGSAPSLDVLDSFAETASLVPSPRSNMSLAMHSDMVEAEKELMLSYRKTALLAMDKLQTLLTQEERIGVAWKRFAISLSNLFAYEKDVEAAKIGDMKMKRANLPYRKIHKATLDDGLRILARQKTDRAVPGLTTLNVMLSAYVADLSTVEPAVNAYNYAVMALENDARYEDDDSLHEGSTESTWEERIKQIAASTMVDVRKKAMRSLNGKSEDSSYSEQESFASQQRVRQKRLLSSERLLFESLTTMCRATPIRVARMAWRYWNIEASQCSSLSSAANSLRTKINAVSPESVTKMIKRHMNQEKEDAVAEVDLIARIVNVGSHKKYGAPGDNASLSSESQVETDSDEPGGERERGLRRDTALQLSRERIGKWDSKLAMAIMEAVGVEDPNVRVEETTRDLRLIRKYAIGLRENLNRCIESIQLLRSTMIDNNGEKSKQHAESSESYIVDCRRDFLNELSKLFSGKYYAEEGSNMPRRASPSFSALAKAGVSTNDPLGWSSSSNSNRGRARGGFTQGRVGALAIAYMEERDKQTDWLLTSMSELLNEYYERVEMVEGFVYMECCAIQLEKHCNQQRAKALAAFEKKTDITSALNVARRKRLGKLVVELQAKLDALGPGISHTSVKETKEAHLDSKTLKNELHDLAMRRLLRARETSTERVVSLLIFWAKEEESSATAEMNALSEAMTALERAVGKEDVDPVIERTSRLVSI